MFVVLEWNQASQQPRIYGGDQLDDNRAAAEKLAAAAREDAHRRGRREQYTVHEVDMEEAA